ncbi:leucine-rich repeat domain-containing protein [Candidatus Finniella inopinata]|uniref:Leucine-rich repeat domain-containing protein n=1 Tax=Candidatus Finniella inopinata TaxID=1696036 RepID=A0A4Q7DNU3_9PROT|nr:leucine-rich repeat domain-containing protein [Candidatus Finniella inopinata]RZI46596.1 leucine-rich repeat domain-containing protein [Candidatus Finniella inopinata]
MKTNLLTFAATILILEPCQASNSFFDESTNAGPKITEINKTWCGLSSITIPADQWRDVETLYLGSNKLTNIPVGLSELPKLKQVYLENNQLRSVDDAAVQQFRRISTLHLQGNKMHRVSKTIGDLNDLKELNLAFNELTSLPAETAQLEKSLSTLNLMGNPLMKHGEKGALGWEDLQKIFGNKFLFNPPKKSLHKSAELHLASENGQSQDEHLTRPLAA